MKVVGMMGLAMLLPVDSYSRKPCNGASQFQFPDCYVPPMDTRISIHDASFLMAHDAGTGYIERKKALHWFYSKTQIGTAYQILNDGARALDIRPKLLSNGTVILQHGAVDVKVALDILVQDAVQWCHDNDDELVLLLTNDMKYENYDGSSGTDAMAQVYASLGVPYYSCDAIHNLTVAEVMAMAHLASGGYLIALDRHDVYGSFCGKSNWLHDELVTCYPSDGSICTNTKGVEPLASLTSYVLASANNPSTDSSYHLGPPTDLETYPFNEIQAMWQVDSHAIVAGLSHVSSLLDDNKHSEVNRDMATLIYDGAFNSISLFAVDHVAIDGNALLSILRTQCGQSILEDACGRALSKPRMMHINMSLLVYWSVVAMISFVLARGIWRSHGHDMLQLVKSRF